MIFKNGFKITQFFGSRPDYYRQFGLAGHEGLDVIPKDNDWDIYAIEGGTVVRDIDHPRDFGAYGNLVVILNKTNGRAWWYAHNAKNNVSVGDQIHAGTKIAKMGNTGNTQGDHSHIGLRMADKNGNATNTDNGYLGFINPLPIIESLMQKEGEPVKSQPPTILPNKELPEEFYKINEFETAKGLWGAEKGDAFDTLLEKANLKTRDLDLTIKTLHTDVSARDESITDLKKKLEECQGVGKTHQERIREYKYKIASLEKEIEEYEIEDDSTNLPVDEVEITLSTVINTIILYVQRKFR